MENSQNQTSSATAPVTSVTDRSAREAANEQASAIKVRRASERGSGQHGWLDSRHTFSFADYYDPRWMGFRALRVINEDRVAPARGFPPHGHRDMEILSYVLEGALAHHDSMGNGSVIRPGELQRMSAGSGVTHSEQNASPTEGVHFLQIWVEPSARGLPPSYEQKAFGEDESRSKLRLIGSPDGAVGSVTVHADARLYVSRLAPGERVTHAVPQTRHAWVHVARGRARVQGEELTAGDAAYTSEAGVVAIEGTDGAEVLVFDLALRARSTRQSPCAGMPMICATRRFALRETRG